MNKPFFDLIRVSLNNNKNIYSPTSHFDWFELFNVAKKHSLVGVCFAGLQRLPINQRPDEILYLQWMGIAAKIQQMNEKINSQCTELQTLLEGQNVRPCILKGQGVAQYYSDELRNLRQSGDIDIWVEGGVNACLKLAGQFGGDKVDISDQHVQLHVFDYTAVEAHFCPSLVLDLLANHRLQKWFAVAADEQFEHRNELGWYVPTEEFNLVYLLLHMYRHVFGEGLGLRQLMDYYFVLLSISNIDNVKECKDRIKSFGLKPFAQGVMYIMQTVFGLSDDKLLFEADPEAGAILLQEVMNSGNFGRQRTDDKFLESKNLLVREWGFLKKNLRLRKLGEKEFVWLPIWGVYHTLRTSIKGY